MWTIPTPTFESSSVSCHVPSLYSFSFSVFASYGVRLGQVGIHDAIHSNDCYYSGLNGKLQVSVNLYLPLSEMCALLAGFSQQTQNIFTMIAFSLFLHYATRLISPKRF